MNTARDTIRIIQGLVKQMENINTAMQMETDKNTRLQLQTFQAVTALNIHMINMNLVLLDALGAYSEEPQHLDDDEAEKKKEQELINQRNATFLNNQKEKNND